MVVRTHAHSLTVEQIDTQAAEVARRLTEAFTTATQSIAEVEEGSVMAEEPRIDATTTVAAMERLMKRDCYGKRSYGRAACSW